MQNWYTAQELSKKTDIPESTVRRYLKDFERFFISTDDNSSVMYDSSAIEVLKRIKQLYKLKYKQKKVFGIISSEFPVVLSENDVVENSEKPDIAKLVTSEDVAELKKMLVEMNRKLSNQEEFNAQLIKELADQKKFVNESIEKRDQLLLEKFTEKEGEQKEEKAAEPIKEKKSGLFQRFFGK